MIQQIRNPHMMRGVIWVILIITIPSFVLFYGFSGSGKGRANSYDGVLMTVNSPQGNLKIDRNELARAQTQLEQQYYRAASRMGNSLPMQEAQQAISGGIRPREIGKFAASQLLLEQRLDAQGIRVTDEQVTEALKAEGMTKKQLQEQLKAQRISEYQFVQNVKENLRLSQAAATVNRMAKASLLELWQEYLLANEKVTVAYADIPVTVDEKLAIDDAALKAEYDKLVADKFTLVTDPERRVYRYTLMPAPPRTQQTPTEEQLKKAFEEASKDDPQMQMESQASLTQILSPFNPTATLEQRNAAKAAAEEALKKIQAGTGFEAAANQYIEDMETRDFSEYTSGTMLLAGQVTQKEKSAMAPVWGSGWVDFATTAVAGKVSDVLETPKGYVIARVENRSEPRPKTFDEAKPLLSSRVSGKLMQEAEQARQAAIAENLQKVRDAARTESSLDGIAAKLSQDVKTTSPTMASAFFVVGIGSMNKEKEALKALTKGELSPVLQTDRGDIVVMEITEVLPEAPKKLDEVKEPLLSRLRRAKAAEQAKADAEALKATIGAEDYLTSKTLTYKVTTVDPFVRQQPPPQLYSVLELRSILAANKGEVVVSGVGSEDNLTNYYVLQITNVDEPKKEEFLKNLSDYEGGFLAVKREAFVEEYRADLIAKSKMDFKSEYFQERETKKKPKK